MTILLLTLASCSFPRPPDLCAAREDCAAGMTCDLNTGSCVEDIGNEDNTCALDDECPSRVCQADSVCAAPESVIYVDPSGISAGDCPATAACELSYARTKVTTAKNTVRLGDGRYDLIASILVDATTGNLTIVGGRNAVLQAPHEAIEVKGGATLNVRGITITKPLACVDSQVNISNVVFTGAVIIGQNSWIALTGCMSSVTDSDLTFSSGDGIGASGGAELRVLRTRIQRSRESGISSSAQRTFITESIINNNSDVGIRLLGQDQVSSVQKNAIYENFRGGLFVSGGRADISNNYIYTNGNPNEVSSGGLHINASLTGNRIIHNTIVQNSANPDISVTTGGFYCRGSGNFANNLIAGNFLGPTATMQVDSTCDLTGSLISDQIAQLRFVSAAAPFDFHLADANSQARNTGIIGTAPATEDFDGDPRTHGAPDVGADELVR